ncbi:amino acid ABC transporter permease [Saccharibacillus sp. CPCC 101409]|uniref:amino acid ABC transporter permease n=1 Tax=Saccharibacillus sp. CPCC 101409 TaxID=3058041 RepID=UPI0026713CEB|nr:amino acid ABC transporter permease [Saccharibacillus sp. CPCC 101409]MDO3409116.1 amino acid ABC transporter permease [Saccharibacillus sp. CPCC 101409]
MLDFSILTNHLPEYGEGFLNTIKASVFALLGSFVLGTIIAVFRISGFKPLRLIGAAYVEFIRNIPILIVVLFFFLGLPSLGFKLDGFQAGTLGLTVYTAAFIAEAIRAGIQSVPAGQTEAARSSGMTYMQTMLHVVLPQAIKLVIPPLSNQFINLIKNSSVLTIVSGFDLMYFADIISSETYVTFSTYIFAAVFYLLLTLPLSFAALALEKRLARSA